MVLLMATWRAIKRWEYFEQNEEGSDEDEAKKGKSADGKLELELDEKKKRALESYYHRRFWNAMLSYNRLRIYLTQYNDKNKEGDNEELRLRTAKWDMGLALFKSKDLKGLMIAETACLCISHGPNARSASICQRARGQKM